MLYVPENDQDYDVVYLQTASGANLAYSFSEDEGWKPVKTARLSTEVKRLAETIEPHLSTAGVSGPGVGY